MIKLGRAGGYIGQEDERETRVAVPLKCFILSQTLKTAYGKSGKSANFKNFPIKPNLRRTCREKCCNLRKLHLHSQKLKNTSGKIEMTVI